MAKNINELPITEIVERARKLARAGENTLEKIRGIAQDVYCRDIPSKYDWNFLIASSSIESIDQYKTGTVSINTGSRIASFSSDVTVTDAMAGRLIKFTGNDVVYSVNSYMTAQSLQILPPLRGPNNISSATYSIFQPYFALAYDFDRFPKDGGVYKWEGGAKKRLSEKSYQDFTDDYQSTPSNPDNIRIISADTAGNTRIEFTPAPAYARIYGYDYIKSLKPLNETTAGTLSSISAKATSVVGNSNTRFLDAYANGSSNLWFRADALGVGQDSQWYPIILITTDSALTLGVAFANSAITSSANYTISKAPEMPVRLHPGVLYGTLMQLALDQNDDSAQVYYNQYASVLSDAKRIHVSRSYSTEFKTIAEDIKYRV